MHSHRDVSAEDGEIADTATARKPASAAKSDARAAALLPRAMVSRRGGDAKRTHKRSADGEAAALKAKLSRSHGPTQGVQQQSNPKAPETSSSTVNNGHTNRSASKGAASSTTPSAGVEIVLSFERDEEAEAERLLEERRRRRKEILQIDVSSQPPVAGRVLQADATGPLSASQFALEKQESDAPKVNTDDHGVSAADYDPNTDANADDMRHRAAAMAMAAARSNAPSAGADGAGKPPKADSGGDDDDFDMFADDDKVPDICAATGAGAGAGVGISAAGSMMADSWDDSEGYYRTIIGELLNGRYLVQAFLGQGVFSSVVRAADTQNRDAPVAIKIIRQNEVMYKAGAKEQRILERLHEADPDDKMHVVQLLGSFVHRGHLCLCFELMSLNLREVVRKYGRDSGLSLQAVRVYAMHLFLALDLLRRCRVIHGDIKPDNCFVSEQRTNVKLGDLGSACDVSENEITPYLVSRFYRAPEIILGLPYNYAIDMWSVGVTLFELYTGKILLPGRNNNHMLRLMMEVRGHLPNRMLRRGQFWQQHFADNGAGAMDFISRSVDKLSGAETEQRMVFAKPTLDIKARVLQATPAGSSSEATQQALRFASLLERCLELSPEKRIAPIDALRHPFIVGK
ncbi:U4/U6 small nuclear ribonucleoprotein prp4 [Coemansia sp. RSA 2705]|nr:U4/U6 small nuclear ribonucleoprotein prp4 [Coemansia sp. RSA 2705]